MEHYLQVTDFSRASAAAALLASLQAARKWKNR